MSAADDHGPNSTPVALLQLGSTHYALAARHVHSVITPPAGSAACVDLMHRLTLTADLPQRWALQLQGYSTLLLVGQRVQIRAVPTLHLETLPTFLAGLSERACLQGWVTYQGHLHFLLDLQRVMRSAP